MLTSQTKLDKFILIYLTERGQSVAVTLLRCSTTGSIDSMLRHVRTELSSHGQTFRPIALVGDTTIVGTFDGEGVFAPAQTVQEIRPATNGH